MFTECYESGTRADMRRETKGEGERHGSQMISWIVRRTKR